MPRLSTWLVGDEAFNTGGVSSSASTPAARAASIAGVDVDMEVIGVDDSSDGLAESVACLGVD
jgi:hypothetical protein